MLFNSYEFIFVFLPITLVIFYLIGARGYHRISMSWLVGTSLFFYGWWNPAYLALILTSMLFNYAVGLSLWNNYKGSHRKFLLICAIAVNLGLISYFKYANFFVDSVNIAIKTSFHLETIILPLAISFFTFQQIAYIVDSYKGETKEYDFLHYCLFVTFFPQLIAGPIVHHKELMPQFAKISIYSFNYHNVSIGLTIFLFGLFKKVVLADSAGLYATPVFDAAENGEPLSFYVAWGGALSYTFQLYFDFSGYSDMAIGLARLFGIQLPMNFNSPYKSVNIIDFWRRWHITLSRFLRDYIYIPLGGNRKGKERRYINIMVTMLLGGLWHGAGWSFVAWGGLHGVYILANHFWQDIKKKMGVDLSKTTLLGIISSMTLTFVAVVVSWVFFRSDTFSGSIHMLTAMMDFPNILNLKFENLAKKHLIFLLLLYFLVLFAPNTQSIVLNISDKSSALTLSFLDKVNSFLRWEPGVTLALVAGLMFTFTLLLLERKSEFLYFQF